MYDIGCGMIFRQTNIPISTILETKTKDNQPLINFMLGTITRVVPVGFAHHKDAQEWVGFDQAPEISVIQRELESSRKQLGTLGGGNHFIEIQKGSDNHVWVMIHSGSRNIGLKVAEHYNKLAIQLNERWHSSINT